MKLLTFDPRKNKEVLVGEIIEKTLIRNVNSKHLMRKFDAYGIQENAFQKAIEMGVTTIVQNVEKTNDSWVATIEEWVSHGKVMDFGNGKQRFLSLKHMKRIATRTTV